MKKSIIICSLLILMCFGVAYSMMFVAGSTASSGAAATTFSIVSSESGMAWTNTVGVDLTGISSGDLIVCYAYTAYSSTPGAMSVTEETTDTAFTNVEREDLTISGAEYAADFFYLTSATTTGTVTYTFTAAGSATLSRLACYSATPSQTPTFDQYDMVSAASINTAWSTDDITTTGSGITFAASYCPTSTIDFDGINGSAVDGSEVGPNNIIGIAYSIIGETYTGDADFGNDGSTWTGHMSYIVNFK